MCQLEIWPLNVDIGLAWGTCPSYRKYMRVPGTSSFGGIDLSSSILLFLHPNLDLYTARTIFIYSQKPSLQRPGCGDKRLCCALQHIASHGTGFKPLAGDDTPRGYFRSSNSPRYVTVRKLGAIHCWVQRANPTPAHQTVTSPFKHSIHAHLQV